MDSAANPSIRLRRMGLAGSLAVLAALQCEWLVYVMAVVILRPGPFPMRAKWTPSLVFTPVLVRGAQAATSVKNPV